MVLQNCQFWGTLIPLGEHTTNDCQLLKPVAVHFGAFNPLSFSLHHVCAIMCLSAITLMSSLFNKPCFVISTLCRHAWVCMCVHAYCICAWWCRQLRWVKEAGWGPAVDALVINPPPVPAPLNLPQTMQQVLTECVVKCFPVVIVAVWWKYSQMWH